MSTISMETKQQILDVARGIKQVLEQTDGKFGKNWATVSGDQNVRDCVSFMNKLSESRLPEKIEAKGDAAAVIIAGINPSEVWDGTLGGVVSKAIVPFKALFFAVTGNWFGMASSALEIRKVMGDPKETGDLSSDVKEVQSIKRFYNIEFLDRNSLLLERQEAVFHSTSMTPSRVMLGGGIIKKDRQIV